MTSSLTIEISKTFKHTATREQGSEARKSLMALLNQHPTLILDFSNVQTSVSFIDECIGLLAQALGEKDFHTRINFKNTSPEINALLSHIIARRLSIE